MLASLGAELVKLRKRVSTWVLASIWLALVILLNYVLIYVLVSNAPAPTFPAGTPEAQQEQIQKQQAQFEEQQLAFLYPEKVVPNLIPSFPNLGAPIVLILGALAVGSEYGWATFKTVLTQQPGRLSVFCGKLLALGVLLALLSVLVFLAGLVSGYVIAGLSGGPLRGPPVGALVRALGAGWLILAVWATLGALLATLFRGTALAVGLGLVYSLGLENIITSLPVQNETLQRATEYLPGQNATSLAGSFAGQGSAPKAALVLLAYTAVFVLLAAFVFRRRDVN